MGLPDVRSENKLIRINGNDYPTVSDLLSFGREKRNGKNYVNGKSGVFFVRSSNIQLTSNGNEFSQVVISDAKRSMNAKVWGKVEEGELLFADYEYSTLYHSFSLTPIRSAKSEKAPDIAHALIPHFNGIQEMERCLLFMIGSVKNEHLRRLLREIFVEDKDFYSAFVESTAASRNHHVGRGGLLFHTISVAKVGLNLISSYPELNRDLVLTGCLIHDIGKVESYDTGPAFEYTTEGKLENHIVIGIKMLTRFIDRISNFPKDLENVLTHIMASHHGQLEYGSPIVPKIPEAMAVHFADEVDAKLRAALDIVEDLEKNTWSEWHSLLRTDLFKFEVE